MSTTTIKGRILVVDDDRAACALLADGLAAEGFESEWRLSGDEALTAVEANAFDAVITDLNMQGMKGTEVCRRVAALRPGTPVLVVTAFGSMDAAVEALRAGAYDFITKPFEIEAVAHTLERALAHRALEQEVQRLRRAVDETKRFGRLLGASPAIREVYDLIERIADSESTVLVTGESGTGKEVVAHELHERSRRAGGPFVAINCAAMPEPLLESELFGHVKGAFTDAKTAKQGLLVGATGGTLFLDEIGDMPTGLQPKLLRALQERTVRPVGGTSEVSFNARVVAATNRDLETAVSDGRFREDLYYRINVINVALPPLRARGGDILLLAQAFSEELSARAGKDIVGLSREASERLMGYDWPGNVRELSNCIERAVALARGEQIEVADLPDRIRRHESRHVLIASNDPTDLVPLEEMERRYVLRVLEAVKGNKSMAAKILGLSRKTLYRRLEEYGVEPGGAVSD
jgi:DNA-binding NtrC family response regulator